MSCVHSANIAFSTCGRCGDCLSCCECKALVDEVVPGFSKRTGQWLGYKWIAKKRRFAIYARDEWKCLYCGKNLKWAKRGQRTLDHLQPRSQGGTNENSNLVTSCQACNYSRASRSWREFAAPEAVIRILKQVTIAINKSKVNNHEQAQTQSNRKRRQLPSKSLPKTTRRNVRAVSDGRAGHSQAAFGLS